MKSFEESLVNLKLSARGSGGRPRTNILSSKSTALQILNVGLDLCERNTNLVNSDDEGEEETDGNRFYLYFSVLDRIIKTKQFLHLERETEADREIVGGIIGGLFEHLMQSLINVIPLQIIVR